MKIVYAIAIFIALILLLIFYFSNIINNNYSMYFGSMSNRISMGLGLLLFGLLSMIVGAFTVLLLQSFFKGKPKDFDEFDEDF